MNPWPNLSLSVIKHELFILQGSRDISQWRQMEWRKTRPYYLEGYLQDVMSLISTNKKRVIPQIMLFKCSWDFISVRFYFQVSYAFHTWGEIKTDTNETLSTMWSYNINVDCIAQIILWEMFEFIVVLSNQLIVINRFQNKRSCLYNICLCCVYIYMYI